MKKLPIGFFAVLSISLAVSSAFTISSKTSPSKYDTFQIWGIPTQKAGIESSSADPIKTLLKSRIVLADNPDMFSKLSGDNDCLGELIYQYDNQVFEYMPKGIEEISCPISGDNVCLAYINAKDSTVLAVLNGEFTPVRK